MKNAVAVIALLISLGGIFISLAREEMRCYLGLEENCGVRQKITAPKSTHEAAREPEEKEAISSPKPSKINDRKSEPKIEEPVEKSDIDPSENHDSHRLEKALEGGHDPNSTSQPIEVIPPPEAANKSEGQPIEVIPPPEEHQK